MAHDVFISYSSSDQNAALAVLHGLEATGLRCWMAPRDIKPGAIWAQSIMEGIAGCRVMVVVFSANANRSSHVINEVDAAVRKGAIIVPLRIEDVMPDGAMEYHLRTRHWLDALTSDLESSTARLADQIKGLLETERSTSIPTPPPRPMPDDLPARPRRPPAPPAPGRPMNWRAIRIGAVAAGLLLLGGTYYFSREHPVSGVAFTIREVSGSGGNEASLKVTTADLRFFEGGTPMPPLNQRQYTTVFGAGSARYIYPEVKLLSEAPGRVVNVPMSCEIFSKSGAVSGAVTINGQIQPEWKETYNAHGYGNDQPGTWKPGHYRADCKYGDKLINRAWFDVTESGAAPASPPGTPPVAPNPAPSGPVALVPPLSEVGARAGSLRLYESGYGILPVDQRQYGTSFVASSTRYINVELTLNHSAPGRVINATIYCRFDRGGTTVARMQIKYAIQPTWTSSVNVNGWGTKTPGFWTPGSYTVSCDDGRQTLGQVGFDVR